MGSFVTNWNFEDIRAIWFLNSTRFAILIHKFRRFKFCRDALLEFVYTEFNRWLLLLLDHPRIFSETESQENLCSGKTPTIFSRNYARRSEKAKRNNLEPETWSAIRNWEMQTRERPPRGRDKFSVYFLRNAIAQDLEWIFFAYTPSYKRQRASHIFLFVLSLLKPNKNNTNSNEKKSRNINAIFVHEIHT